VSIDGQIVLRKNLEMSDMGHSYVKRVVRLTRGSHVLEAYSKEGNARFLEKLTLSKERWARLDYWFELQGGGDSPAHNHFTFELHDKPIHIR
jgi:hypothetical protein